MNPVRPSLDRRSLLSRGRQLLTAACAAAGGLLAWWHWRNPAVAALAVVTASLLLIALVLPRAYAPIFRALDAIVHALLQTLTWLLLALVFLAVFLPGRLVLALGRRDPLERGPDPKRASSWRDVPKNPDPARHFRAQF